MREALLQDKADIVPTPFFLLTADVWGLVGVFKFIYMTFTGLEMSAVTKLAMIMAGADGKVEQTELAYMAAEMARFGVMDAEPIIRGAQALDPTIAMAIVEKFDNERKKYVAAYLGTMMAADGDIADKELAIWKLVSSLCSLPSMNIKEAISYIENL